ncbi:MAG: glycosyltransferase family 4 protein [Magnetococcales bacterium]|nr:glycosyltransferase family 4 protein [Magnetococcales bacterium]
MGARILLFYPAMAPYRVDLFNRLAEEAVFRVVFLDREIYYHRELDPRGVTASLRCDHGFLSEGFSLGGRSFPLGLGGEIDRFRPQAVITVEYALPTLLALWHRRGKRRYGLTLLTAENPWILAERRGVRALLARYLPRLCDSMLVYSEEMKSAFEARGVAGGRLFVAANHHEEGAFRSRLVDSRVLLSGMLERYRLAGRKVVLFVGRLVRVKGLEALVRAFARVARRLPEAVLVLVGSGPEAAALGRQAVAEGVGDRVLLPGHREGAELVAWYHLASLFVLNSLWEPYGAVVNEALLAGVPVLCSHRAGSRALIREGWNGRIVDPEDCDALMAGLERELIAAPTAEVTAVRLRDSLMPVTFQRDVDGFLGAADLAARSSGDRS